MLVLALVLVNFLKIKHAIVIGLCALWFHSANAHAQQEKPQSQSVADLDQTGIENVEDVEAFGFRTRFGRGTKDSNFDPFAYKGEPVKFGSFLMFPNITLKQGYNDNVLATQNNTRSDFVTVFAPELLIQKQFGRHNALLELKNETIRYWDETDENVENYSALFQANLEAKRGIDIPISLEYRNGFLDRRDQRRASVNQLTVKPLQNTSFQAETGLIYKPNRLLLSLLGNYRQGRLENERTFAGNTLIRDNRDVDAVGFIGRAAYDVSTGFAPFIEATYQQEDFINERAGANSRDNDLFRVLLGSSFDYRGLLTGYLGVGYDMREYSDSNVDDTDALSIDGNIVWNPTAKTRVSLNLSRATFEDNQIAAGLTETVIGLEGRHEIMRDTFARAFVKYDEDEFDSINRTDETTNIGGELLYIIGPHLQIGADYTYTHRDSTVNGLGLDNSVVFLRAKLAL